MILATRSTPKFPATSGNSASAIKASATEMNLNRFKSLARLEQAFGLPQQDQRHQHIDQYPRSLWQQHLAKSVHHTDQQRRQQRTADRADAANHHHYEADDQHGIAHARIDRRNGRRDHASEHRQRHAGSEHQPVEKFDVDTERLDHLAVGTAGANHHAQPRAREQKINTKRKGKANAGNKKPIHRISHQIAQRHGASQEIGRLDTMHVVTHQQTAQLFEHQNQTVGHQHLLQVLTLIQEAEECPFEQVAQQYREHQSEQQRGEEATADRAGNDWRQRVGHVGTNHVEAAVRQIDDAHDAKDQAQAGSHQEQQQPILYCIQTLDQEGG